MTSSSSPTRSVETLNRLRRDAVSLRLAGATLAETHEAVGLSAPTITAAVRAWRAGGWDAVDVGPRGRPRLRPPAEDGEHPDSAALAAQLEIAARLVPDATCPCWDLDRVIAWLADVGVPASRSTAVARLAEWRLAPPSRHRRLQGVAGADYTRFARRVRRRGATVLWVGDRPLASGATQLFAHDPRGHARWCTVAGAPTSSDWTGFLDGLAATVNGRLAIVLPGAHLARDPALRSWLETCPFDHLIVAPDGTAIPPEHPTTRPRTAEDSPMTTPSTDQPPPAGSSTARAPLTHLERLEAESIHIMREVVAQADNPVMLYSIGKDSAVMLHLARKAFFPGPPPFPLLHVDTRWKFREMYAFRDNLAKEYGFELLTHVNPDGIAQNVNPFTHGSALHTDIMKTEGLKQALDGHRFDVAFGGARRDEEKSRAKERVFSFRSANHRWEPKSQRPELWSLYNARKRPGESIRCFPISNWTELDVWQYIHREDIPIVPLYLAAERPVVSRDGTLIMVDDERMPLHEGEVPQMKKVRFRTLGCYPLTGAVESEAETLPEVIREMLLTKTSERQGRMIDHDSAASMEKKKQEGYF